MFHGRKLSTISLVSFLLILGACSQSQTEDGEELDIDNVEGTEEVAQTDAVPEIDPNEVDPNASLDDLAAADQMQVDPNADPNAGLTDPNMDANAAMAAEPAPVDPYATTTDTTQDSFQATNEPAPADTVAEVPSTEAPTPLEVSSPSESTPVASSSSFSGATEDYRVQRGDTLMLIAFEKYGDIYQWQRIRELNNISNPSRLEVGTLLKIDQVSGVHHDRNGEAYRIRHGDTLGTISRDVYGTSSKWRKLYENNRDLIKNPNRIYAGFTLYYVMSPEDVQDKQNAPQPTLSRQAIEEENQASAPIPPMPEMAPQAQNAPETPVATAPVERAPAATDDPAAAAASAPVEQAPPAAPQHTDTTTN